MEILEQRYALNKNFYESKLAKVIKKCYNNSIHTLNQ